MRTLELREVKYLVADRTGALSKIKTLCTKEIQWDCNFILIKLTEKEIVSAWWMHEWMNDGDVWKSKQVVSYSQYFLESKR